MTFFIGCETTEEQKIVNTIQSLISVIDLVVIAYLKYWQKGRKINDLKAMILYKHISVWT